MTASQIILYLIIGIVLIIYIKRWIQKVKVKEYTPKQVYELLYDSSVLLLDVRTKEERNYRHIAGSLHIPINELLEKIKQLEKHRHKEIICYCHSGSRSYSAVLMLNRNGFNAVNMKGGIVEWNFQNLK